MKSFRILLLLILAAVVAGPADAQSEHWVASWVTSPATYFVYVPPVPPAAPGFPMTYAPANIQPDLAFPFPTANQNQALNQTIRSMVKPDLWGNRMRFRFSNVFGDKPLVLSAVSIGLQDYSGNVMRATLKKCC